MPPAAIGMRNGSAATASDRQPRGRRRDEHRRARRRRRSPARRGAERRAPGGRAAPRAARSPRSRRAAATGVSAEREQHRRGAHARRERRAERDAGEQRGDDRAGGEHGIDVVVGSSGPQQGPDAARSARRWRGRCPAASRSRGSPVRMTRPRPKRAATITSRLSGVTALDGRRASAADRAASPPTPRRRGRAPPRPRRAGGAGRPRGSAGRRSGAARVQPRAEQVGRARSGVGSSSRRARLAHLAAQRVGAERGERAAAGDERAQRAADVLGQPDACRRRAARRGGRASCGPAAGGERDVGRQVVAEALAVEVGEQRRLVLREAGAAGRRRRRRGSSRAGTPRSSVFGSPSPSSSTRLRPCHVVARQDDEHAVVAPVVDGDRHLRGARRGCAPRTGTARSRRRGASRRTAPPSRPAAAAHGCGAPTRRSVQLNVCAARVDADLERPRPRAPARSAAARRGSGR